MKYSAVIAAAGLSSRMHELKPLMKLGSGSMIKNVIDNLRDAGTEEIAVVTGYKAEQIEKHLEGQDVILCCNHDFSSTKMLDSVKLGLRKMNEETVYDYVFITPVDVPLVSPETMKRMMETAEQGSEIIRPSFDGKAGHPLLLKRDMADELMEYGGEGGIRGFLDIRKEQIAFAEVGDRGILQDADTKEDYKKLRRLEMEKKGSLGLWYEMDIRVLKGEPVLTQEKVQLLEMIDHTGSIQSACACMHMSYSKGWSMIKRIEKELGYQLTVRTPGGEGGGGTVLSERGRRVLSSYRKFTSELKEISEELFNRYFEEEIALGVQEA